MIGRVKITIQTRHGAGKSWPMGKLRVDHIVEWTVSENGWLKIEPGRWVPAYAVDVILDIPIPLPPVVNVPSGPDIRMVKEHIEMPAELRNYGSFGIVRAYAHPKADKPHSLIYNNAWTKYLWGESGLNTTSARKWMAGQDHTRNPLMESNGIYSLPTQCVFMKNYVRIGRVIGKFTEILALDSKPPLASEHNHFSHPTDVHFMWCVNQRGETINPPCGVAFLPIISNPVRLKGGTIGGKAQTELWVESMWLKEVS